MNKRIRELTQMAPPSTITFFSRIPEPRVKVMEITAHGIWVNPDVSVDDTAKSVLSALQIYLGKFIKEAVNREREACAKVCEKEAQEAYHQEAFYLPQGNPGLLRIAEGAKRCADQIRARGGEK
jgi:hypothetical protein